MSRRTVLAAGGVLWRPDPQAPADPQVALVHRPQYGDWSLPKGKSKPGEHLLVTALREMGEETGYRPRIGPYLSTVRSRVRSGGHSAEKVITYWSMKAVGGQFRPSHEVDELCWLSVDDARQRLTAAADRGVLDTFANTRRGTSSLLLVRQGLTATTRRRPAARLSRSGRAQAQALVPVLASLGATTLLSADVPACAEMLAPFAAAAGLAVRRESVLTSGEFTGHESEGAEVVRRHASPDHAMVVCGSGQVLRGLLTALAHVRDVQPPTETAVSKGGWWLLHHSEGAISAYERHEPAA